jgi:hypothetical protein
VINRPRDEVAAFAADPSRAPDWYVNIESVEWLTAPPVTVGSRVAFVAHFLGRRLAYTYQVVELDPGRRLVMRTHQGPFPMETTYAWSSTPEGGTRMTLRNRGEPAGFSRLVAPFMARAMRRANAKDLARLKQLLKTHGERPARPRHLSGRSVSRTTDRGRSAVTSITRSWAANPSLVTRSRLRPGGR